MSRQITAPPLLRCLSCGAEPAGDLAPGVPERSEPVDGVPGSGVQLGGQAQQVGQGVDVSVGDPCGEGCVVGVLHLAAGAPRPIYQHANSDADLAVAENINKLLDHVGHDDEGGAKGLVSG
jgi:hypothetical protein